MLLDKVKAIIAEQLEVEELDEMTVDTTLMGDLEADSLDAVEIMMALEDEFEVEIPDEDAEAFKNIGDIVDYLEGKISK